MRSLIAESLHLKLPILKMYVLEKTFPMVNANSTQSGWGWGGGQVTSTDVRLINWLVTFYSLKPHLWDNGGHLLITRRQSTTSAGNDVHPFLFRHILTETRDHWLFGLQFFTEETNTIWNTILQNMKIPNQVPIKFSAMFLYQCCLIYLLLININTG